MKTVKIDGIDHPYFGMTDDRRGIITESQTFWLFPECLADGSPVDELPVNGPVEIKAVTFDEPDITDRFLDEVKKDYAQHQEYWHKITPEEHAKEYDLLPSREGNENNASYTERVKRWFSDYRTEFEKCKKEHLSKSFENYQCTIGKENTWLRHNTPELAVELGFRDHLNLFLAMKLQGLNPEQIMQRIKAIRYEALYHDPERTVILLKDILEDKHTPAVLRHVVEYRDLMLKHSQTGSLADQYQAAKRTLRDMMNKKTISVKTFACWDAYMRGGTLKKANKLMGNKMGLMEISKNVKECEVLMGKTFMNPPRGGRGVHRESIYEDNAKTQGISPSDNPVFDEVCRNEEGESPNEE